MYQIHKILIMIVLCSLYLMSGCTKETTVDPASLQENKESYNYREAHYFVGDSSILKEGYLPMDHGDKNLTYKQYDFQNLGTGYYYISNKDTPYLKNMFFNISYMSGNTGFPCAETSDEFRSLINIQLSNGRYFGNPNVLYYIPKNSSKVDTICGLNLGGNENNGRNSVYWFGVVDKEHGYITFEIYFTKSDFIPPQMYCKSQILGWIANKDFNIEVVKKLENVRFKYYP